MHGCGSAAQHAEPVGSGRAAGLFWQTDISPWFSVRAALSAAFTSLLYVDSGLADPGTAAQLEAFAKTQLDYVLGTPGRLEHLALLRSTQLCNICSCGIRADMLKQPIVPASCTSSRGGLRQWPREASHVWVCPACMICTKNSTPLLRS